MSLAHDIGTPAYMAVVLFDDDYTTNLKDPFEDHSHPDWRGSNVDTLMGIIDRGLKNDRMKKMGTNPDPFMGGADSVVADVFGRSEDYVDPGWSMDVFITTEEVPEIHQFKKRYCFESWTEIQCWIALERIGELALSMGMELVTDERKPAENPKGEAITREYRDEALGVTAAVVLKLDEYRVSGWLRQFDVDSESVQNEIEIYWRISIGSDFGFCKPVPEVLKSKKIKNKLAQARLERKKV
jgi:hypothetical protein